VDLGLLEQKLREMPGVLDCAVSAEGVAVVVHPEVDPRLIELQAQVLLAECGDRRPLLVVGGMTVGPRVVPPTTPTVVRARRSRLTAPSPLSLVAFAVLVLGLLAVVPIAGREGGSDHTAAPAERAAGSGRVPVEDGDEQVVVTVGKVDAAAVEAPPASASASSPDAVASSTFAPAFVAPAAPVVAPAVPSPSPPTAGVASTRRKGHGRERAGEMRAAAARDKGEVVALALPPGASEQPGRRRGHDR